MKDFRFVNGIGVGFALGSILWGGLHAMGRCGKVRKLENELISNRQAEWVIVDPLTGKTEFKLKEGFSNGRSD